MPTVNGGAALLRPTAEAAFDAWRAMAQANREQVERLREEGPPRDFWAGRAAQFRPDGGLAAVETPYLLELARPDDRWLDIGAGGGRFGVPLARRVQQLVAVEPSPAMREVLGETTAEANLTNVTVLDVEWPPAQEGVVPRCDVSLTANVLYSIESLREFLEAMEQHTSRLCVAILGNRAPPTPDEPVWTELHGEPLAALPALPAFVAVLGAWGRRYDVRTFPLAPPQPVELDEAVLRCRRFYWVAEGSAKEERLRELLLQHYGQRSGLVALPPRLSYTPAVAWAPPHAASPS